MVIEIIKSNPEYQFKPFIFIGEKLNPKFSVPYKIDDIALLKTASDKQVIAIKEIVKPNKLLSILRDGPRPTNIYEYDFVETKNEHGSTIAPVPLAPAEFKYWIFELSGEYLGDFTLIQAIHILSKNLTVIANIGELMQYFHKALVSAIFYTNLNLLHQKPVILDENDIIELKENYELLKKFKSSDFNSSFIGKALLDYNNTLDIEWSNPFKIIGIFSIIETLLTSNQKGNDNSINKQLQKKIKLLNNQFKKKIIFSEYFKGPDTLTIEIVIEKLYAYRSKIAHGDYYDFNKELQVLVDHKLVLDFLTILLKRIITYALAFPQLIIDLKEC